jgi:hypothetical protein
LGALQYSEAPLPIISLGDTQDGGYKLLHYHVYGCYSATGVCIYQGPVVGSNVIRMTARFMMAILMVGTISPVRTAPTTHGSQVGPANDVGETIKHRSSHHVVYICHCLPVRSTNYGE